MSVAGMVRGVGWATSRGNTYATELELDTRNPLPPEPADGGSVLGRVQGASMTQSSRPKREPQGLAFCGREGGSICGE